jgi:hypothetical protein
MHFRDLRLDELSGMAPDDVRVVYATTGPLIPMDVDQWSRVRAERQRRGHVLTREEVLAILAAEGGDDANR